MSDDVDLPLPQNSLEPYPKATLELDSISGVERAGLDVEIDVTATPVVVCSGSEQPNLRIGAEYIGDRCLDRFRLIGRQTHIRIVHSELISSGRGHEGRRRNIGRAYIRDLHPPSDIIGP